MNRFQMLKRQEANKPIAYRFKQTNSSAKVLGYLKKCIQDDVAFDSSNIYPSVVDQALATLNRETKIPIITKSEKTMRLLNLVHNLQGIYTIDNIPARACRVICYTDLNPKEIPKSVEVALSIFRKEQKETICS